MRYVCMVDCQHGPDSEGAEISEAMEKSSASAWGLKCCMMVEPW
jgi:hypothetical protein